MFNIRKAATAATAVAVAGACVVGHVTRARKNENPTVVEEIKNFYSPEFIACLSAQRVSSDRMLSGRYDDFTDEQVQAEYNVLYANFLTK